MIAHLATKHFQNVWLLPAGHVVTRSPQHRDQRLGGGDGLVGQGPAGFCQIDDVDRHPDRVGGVFGGEPWRDGGQTTRRTCCLDTFFTGSNTAFRIRCSTPQGRHRAASTTVKR